MTDYRYAWRYGHRWVWWYVRNGRIVAALRVAWVTYVRGWSGQGCQTCGRRYYPVIWHARNDLWLAVHGSVAGILCPACFVREAARKGIELDWLAARWNINDPSTWDLDQFDA